MRKALYVILTALLLVHNITGIKAQGYPVQATLNIGLPHSPLLEDYYSGANPLFNLNVLYKDFNSTRPLPVRINFTIESNNGFKLTTNPSFTPQPLYINGGENYRIEDSELSQYFGNSALLITGSGSNNFTSQRRLPEGFYRITLRVHEYHRNIPISNVAIAVVWIKDNDPPQWVMPQNNTTIKARFPQNISFSWMKRHIPPPVGRSEVVYRFELFEMNNPSVTPEVVVRSQRPLYSEDIDNTTLIYSADKPMLTPGKSYVCRIQAKDELNYLRFKNSGYSTPLKFTFGKECRKPYNIQIQEPTKSGVTVDWQTDYFGDPTELRIRETGANQSEWYGYKSSNQTVNVHQLYAGRDYEIQLRNVCDQDLYSEWTQPQALRTQSPETTTNNQRNCTGKEISVDIIDPTPLAVLEVGDIITVNGFPVTITSVEGSNGVFSGTGDMFVPFTGGKIQSVFSNITVTNSMQVSAGQVRAVRGPKVTFTNQGSDNNNSDDADDDSDKFTVTGDTLTLTNGGGIDSLYLNGDGDVIIIDTHGDTINTGKKDITIVDNTGGTGDTESDTTDTYVVQGGTITKTSGPASTGTGGSSGSASQSVNDSNIKLRFISPIDNGSGGFDKPLHQVMISGGAYNSRQYDGNNYYVPWRSVESGKSAFIVAELKIENDTLKTEHITFTNDAGVKLQVQPATGPDKKATYVKVLINGTSHEEVQRVTAGYTIKKDKGESENRELAWIDIISYNSEPVDLVIATANGQKPTMPLSRLEQELNRIYGQSVIRFRLSQIDLGNTDFDKNGDNLVDAGSTGMLSNYTAETRAIKRAVRRHQAYDKKAFYIVMAPEASEGVMLKGRWALKTQVGFVFNPKGMSDEQFIHTVAHESGHGIFRLWHTFSSKNNYQLAKGATTNLMDYSTKPNATDLFKYQWDYCHNPENMTGLFQDDEEGESVYKVIAKRSDYIVDGNGYATFLSPAGMPITIKPEGDIEIIVSSTNDTELALNSETGSVVNYKLSVGTLFSFTENKTLYAAIFDADNNFLGYKDNENNEYKYDNITIKYTIPYSLNLIDANERFYLFDSYLDLSAFDNNEYKANGDIVYPLDKDRYKEIAPTLNAESYEQLVNKLRSRFNNQLSNSDYVYFDKSLELDKDLGVIDIEDRLSVFKVITKNRIFIDILYLEEKPTEEQLLTLADDVYNVSDAKNSSDIIYMIIPIWNVKKISKVNLRSESLFRYNISFYSKNEVYNNISDLVEYKSIKQNSIYSHVLGIYKLVPKPYHIYNYYLTYKGDLIKSKPVSETEVIGKDHIYDMIIQFDDRIDRNTKGLIAQNMSEPNGAGLAYRLMDSFIDRPQNIKVISLGQIGLKESHIMLEYGHKTADKFARWYSWFEFKIWSGKLKQKEASSPDNISFISGRNTFEHEQILARIDAIGAGLSLLELDILADIAGGIYCLTVGDVDNARIYGSGAFLPVAGGALRLGKGAIKGIAKGSKTLVRINGKLALLPDFRFDVYTFLQHKMPDELDNIQKLHDKIVKHKVVADNFTVEFAELLVKAGEGRTQVLAQIGKWDKKALNALSKDLKNPKFAKEFFEGVKTNPGLVEAWNVVSDLSESIRKNFSVEDIAKIRKYLDDTGESITSLQKRIPANKDFAKNWIDNLHWFGKQIGKKGDYVVEEAGEVFYRTISKDHYDELLKNKKISPTGECTTSPNQDFSEDYEGVLVKFYVKKGTIDKLRLIGVSDGHPRVTHYFGDMPSAKKVKETTGMSWNQTRARFKVETLEKTGTQQVNIALGKGDALDIFNENIVTIEMIKITDIKK